MLSYWAHVSSIRRASEACEFNCKCQRCGQAQTAECKVLRHAVNQSGTESIHAQGVKHGATILRGVLCSSALSRGCKFNGTRKIYAVTVRQDAACLLHFALNAWFHAVIVKITI